MIYTTNMITTDEAEEVSNTRLCDPFIHGTKESAHFRQNIRLLLFGRGCHDGGLYWLGLSVLKAFVCDVRCQCCTMDME